MRFSDVIGQNELKKNIIQLVQKGHLPHALLLLGHEGSSALPLALATAQYIMCSNKSELDSCGTCKSCSKVHILQHPDFHVSFPAGPVEKPNTAPSEHYLPSFREFTLTQPYGNDSDWFEKIKLIGKGNISALECRSIIQRLQLRSFEAEYKIMLIWYPEYMGEQGNILLKLIEEPSDKTIILLVTENSEQLLATILSRTQLFELQRTEDQELAAFLEKQHIEPEKARHISKLAEGNIRKAIQMTGEQEDDSLLRLRNWLNALYGNRGIELSDWCTDTSTLSKENQSAFWTYVLQMLEHYLRFKIFGPQGIEFLEAEQKLIETLLKQGLSEQSIGKISEKVTECIYLIGRNANAKIVYHSLSLHIQEWILADKSRQVSMVQ